jgi:hypothetical protein
MSSTEDRQRGKQVLFTMNENVTVKYGLQQWGQQKNTISGHTILILTAGSEMTNYFLFLCKFLDFIGQSTLKATMNPITVFHPILHTCVIFSEPIIPQNFADISPFSGQYNHHATFEIRPVLGFLDTDEQFSYNGVACGCVVSM